MTSYAKVCWDYPIKERDKKKKLISSHTTDVLIRDIILLLVIDSIQHMVIAVWCGLEYKPTYWANTIIYDFLWQYFINESLYFF